VQVRKVFFSEEKKQKTFMSLSRIFPEAYAIDAKVFWFFSSKKNCFAFLSARHMEHLRDRQNGVIEATDRL